MSNYRNSSGHGSSRSGASPIIKDILRGAFEALTEPPSSSSHNSRSSSRRDRDRDHHAPRRTATQPEPRRHRDADEYTGIPSHSYSAKDDSYRSSSRSASNSDDLKEMLGKAAVELSRLVSGFEERLRRTDKVDARPGQFQNDEERFEVLSDSDPETYSQNRGGHDSGFGHGHYEQPHQRQHHQQQQRGLADEYYFPEYLPGHQAPQAPPATANAAYPNGPIYPPQYPHGQNTANMNYHHPQPVDPSFPDYHNPSDARPKPKRSATSASQTMRKVGNEILQNLPQLIQRAGWLLKVLEGQQKRSGGKSRSITGYSGLLMALNVVMELYRQFAGEKKARSRGGSRERRR